MLVIWWYLSGAHGLLTHTVTHVAEPGYPANPGRRAEPLPNPFMPGVLHSCSIICTCIQGLSQDLESGCLKLAIVKYLGVQIFKGDHKILIFQP